MQTEMNDKLIPIWSQVLGVDTIDHKDNFFSLGGHSLLAIELLHRIEEQFLIRLNMQDIVESPTVNELASRILQQTTAPKRSERIFALSGHNSYPLTLNQKQVWSLNVLYPDSPAHHISTLLRIGRNVNEEAARKAIHYIGKRQEALRTSFNVQNGQPVQEIHPEFNLKVPFIDIEEKNLIQLATQEIRRPFKLNEHPLIRIIFYRIAPDNYAMFFMAHHIIWDGISNTLFFHEFNHCYQAFLEDRDPDLPPLKMSLKEYALNEMEYLHGADFLEQTAEWKKILKGPLPTLNLPGGLVRPAKIRNDISTYFFEIGKDKLLQLESYAQAKHLSVYHVLMTVYNVTLANITGTLDLIVGTPVHGRHHRDIRKAFGYFSNFLPVRSQLNADLSFKENISIILESLKNAFYNQQVPLDVLIREAGQTLYQTLFLYLDVTKELDVFEELKFEQIKIDRQAGHSDIDFYLYKSRSKIEIYVEYKKDLYSEDPIEHLVKVFNNVLDSILVNDEQPLPALGVKFTMPRASNLKDKIKRFNKSSAIPQTQLHQDIAEIWKEALNLDEIGVEENFFDLGGHSILAVEIFNQINERYQIDLPLASIIEGITINGLVEKIQQEMSEQKLPDFSLFKHVVPLRVGTNAKNLFCFHGVGGNILNYYRLTDFVGELSFYGIQSAGVTSDTPLPQTIEEMASLYIEEIKLLSPKGPYHLAGGSMGGLLALEVAQQLKRSGDQVSALIMFDTFGPNRETTDTDADKKNFFTRCLDSLQGRSDRFIKKIQFRYYQFINKAPPLELRFFRVQENNLLAMNRYQVKPYDDSVILIRAPKKRRGTYADPKLGWEGTLTGEFEIIEVDGSHEKLIENPSFVRSFQSVVSKL